MTFALAGVFFQISCSNSNESKYVSNTLQKFIYIKKDFPTTGDQSIWIANFDGTNQTQIPISLPNNISLYTIYSSGEHSTVKLSNDEQTILFTAQNNLNSEVYIYSCNVDGTNLQQLMSFNSNTGIFL